MFGNNYWTYNNQDDEKISKLANKLNISKSTSRILLNRGLEDITAAERFIRASLEDLYDPFLFKDMEKAVKRIKKAVDSKEAIWLYGDYDVDGVSSVSVLVKYFNNINYPINYYIPNRLEEGYGINLDAIDDIHKQGGSLIITVDCGITSVKEVDHGNTLGIDMIITDHHECQGELPKAFAIINPKQKDCSYPFKSLCGCGIAFKLIQALTLKEVFSKELYDYIDIVALATIADIVPLVEENRIIVKNGLATMQTTNNAGIQALMEVSGLKDKKLTAGQIGFTLAPRINAAGRIGDADGAVSLLTSENYQEALRLAQMLDKENRHRQQIEKDIHNDALDIIEHDKSYQKEKFLVLYKEDWHHGVIGIVASRIVEKYYRPVIILSIEGDEAKGSARSIPGFNLFEALHQCKDLFIKFGGHEQAAGLSIKVENIEVFRKKINQIINDTLTEEDFIPEIGFDDHLRLSEINERLMKELELLEPYGMGNPGPKFVDRLLKPSGAKLIGQEGKHLKLMLQRKDHRLEGIGFNLGYVNDELAVAESIDIVYVPEYNEYNGIRKIQLNLKDLKVIKKSTTACNHFSDCYYEAFTLRNKLMEGNKPINTIEGVIVTDDKDSLLLKILSSSPSTLVLVNTVEQAMRLISLSGIQLKKRRTKFRYAFNEISFSGNPGVDIIINPNIDKIDFRRYNKIILYDMFFSGEDFFRFVGKTDIHKTSVLYETGDESSNEEVLSNVIPSREVLVVLYKLLTSNKGEKKLYTKDELLEALGQIIKVPNRAIIKLSLDILTEAKLIEYKEQSNAYEILMLKAEKKVNLEDLRTYKEGQKAIHAFREFYSSVYC